MTVRASRVMRARRPGREMETIKTIPALRRFMRAALDEGLSMRMALLAHRGGGGRVRTEDFAALWRDEVRKRERDQS